MELTHAGIFLENHFGFAELLTRVRVVNGDNLSELVETAQYT